MPRGGSTDSCTRNLQEQIAKRLDYSPRYGQLRSETLMRDYYEHTRDIFRVTERHYAAIRERIRDEQDPLAFQFSSVDTSGQDSYRGRFLRAKQTTVIQRGAMVFAEILRR